MDVPTSSAWSGRLDALPSAAPSFLEGCCKRSPTVIDVQPLPPVDSDAEAPDPLIIFDLSERQRLQEQQLGKHQRELTQLQEQLAQVFVELEKMQMASLKHLNALDVSCKVETPIDDTQTVASQDKPDQSQITYKLGGSTWDALLLLYLKEVTWLDKVQLFMGFALGVGIQLALLVTLLVDMLRNPYTPEKLQDMMRWRVDVGHGDPPSEHGASMASRMCAGTLWSYEQDQYIKIYEYLTLPIPGMTLAFVATFIWILRCLVEFQRVMEQATAVMTIPNTAKFRVRVAKAGDELQIVSINPVLQVSVVMLACAPRFAVLASFCIGGCRFITYSVALQDIVLGAVELAFMLEVDRMLPQALLPQRLQAIVENLHPLPCWEKSNAGSKRSLAVRDIIRYVLALAVMVIALVAYLMPFSSDVNAASLVLCGGLKDFTAAGGSTPHSTLVLKNTSDWISNCDGVAMDNYMRRVYDVGWKSDTAETFGQREMRRDLVYGFALQGCDEGRILSPSGACVKAPRLLQLQQLRPNPPRCQVFNASLGARACDEMMKPTSCVWSWGQQACENWQEPPGSLYHDACGSDLQKSCRVWRSAFGMDHPSVNCLSIDLCPSTGLDCLAMQGAVRLSVGNTTALRGHGDQTWSTIKATLAGLAGIPLSGVCLQRDNASLNTIYPNEGSLDFHFLLSEVPHTLKPSALLRKGPQVAASANSMLASESVGASAPAFVSARFHERHVLGTTSQLTVNWTRLFGSCM